MILGTESPWYVGLGAEPPLSRSLGPLSIQQLFGALSTELRSRPAAELDLIFPNFFVAQPPTGSGSTNRCDFIIRDIETIARSTGRVYGDKFGNQPT